MSERDYAIVIGISRYAGLAGDSGEAAHLEGPDNDADAVSDWLLDPDGGNLVDRNVVVIKSSDFRADDSRPRAAFIQEKFEWLENQVRANAAGEDRPPVGRRLYLYLSGHGFTQKVDEGMLFTANATPIRTWHIYANAWLAWFREAGYFEEYVLLMDCCVGWQRSIVAETVPWRSKLSPNPPGPCFVGIAARSGKKALEREMEDHKIHGVFTWTVLKGLRGAAADAQGRITGQSLQDYVFNSMRDFLPEDVRAGREIDIKPFVRADMTIEFRGAPQRQRYATTLQVAGAAEGAELRIWSGSPFARVVTGHVGQGTWRGSLERGLYAVDVPAAGLRHCFEVTGSGDVIVSVEDTGEAIVAAAGNAFEADVRTDNPAATINLIDGAFERLSAASGGLVARLKPGLYKVRVQFGREVGNATDKIFLLDRDLVVDVKSPPIASPAPIDGSAMTHEYQAAAFRALSAVPAVPLASAATARLSFMARYWRDPTDPGRRGADLAHPLYGVALIAADSRRPIDLRSRATLTEDGDDFDPFATCSLDVEPGVYYDRHRLAGGRLMEQTVVACKDWDTRLVIRRLESDVVHDDDGPQCFADIGESTILMQQPGQSEPRAAMVLEAARIALAQGRNLLAEGRSNKLETLLLAKFANPIAGIIGGHLLLLALASDSESRADRRRGWIDDVVRNMRELIGDTHPDVEALSLHCVNPQLIARRPFKHPPMYERSWQLMVQASATQPDLVPPALWQRVHAVASMQPYFAWAGDASTRRSHQRKLRRWVRDVAKQERSQGKVPMAAANALPSVTGTMAMPADPAQQLRTRAAVLQLPSAVLDALYAEEGGSLEEIL